MSNKYSRFQHERHDSFWGAICILMIFVIASGFAGAFSYAALPWMPMGWKIFGSVLIGALVAAWVFVWAGR